MGSTRYRTLYRAFVQQLLHEEGALGSPLSPLVRGWVWSTYSDSCCTVVLYTCMYYRSFCVAHQLLISSLCCNPIICTYLPPRQSTRTTSVSQSRRVQGRWRLVVCRDQRMPFCWPTWWTPADLATRLWVPSHTLTHAHIHMCRHTHTSAYTYLYTPHTRHTFHTCTCICTPSHAL